MDNGDECELLRQQIAALERKLDHVSRKSQWLDGLIHSVPCVIWENWWRAGPLQYQMTFSSKHVEVLTGHSLDEWNSSPDFWLEITHPDDRERAAQESQNILQAGEGYVQYRWIRKDGRVIWIETHLTLMKDETGAPSGFRGVTVDVTARKAAEEEQARLQREMIQMQAAMLAELTTPLIPLSDTVMVMPLIGAIDRARADRVITTLLGGIAGAQARVAIIDITGVPVVDTEFADALVRAAKSVRLLGAEVVLTGIRPEAAQTLVSIGADLTGIKTQGSLQSGIAYAMTRGSAAA